MYSTAIKEPSYIGDLQATYVCLNVNLCVVCTL